MKGIYLIYEPFKILASSYSQIMYPNIAIGRMPVLDSFGNEESFDRMVVNYIPNWG
jgi:hypothetical protein